MTHHPTPGELLREGEQLLAQGDRAGAAQLLERARAEPDTRLAAHNLIERHGLPGAYAEWMGLPCEIAPQDDIYRFFESHPLSINPLRDYLADGWRTLSELMLLLEQVQRPLWGARSVLEFASGHGRFTRHLVKALGAERVVVSDVVDDAMVFARRVFGVRTLASSSMPEEVHDTRTHDVVFVLSLFSHLPRATWSRWLRALYAMVAPGGVLVFTTHGAEAVRRQGVRLDDDGFFFAPSSESQAIDAQEYGTAFTSEAYVRERLVEHLTGARLESFAPQHFWHHQDAWVVAKPAP